MHQNKRWQFIKSKPVLVLDLTTLGLSLINVPGIVVSILNGSLLIVSIGVLAIASRLLRGTA